MQLREEKEDCRSEASLVPYNVVAAIEVSGINE
jgi:hypothetical protein